MSSPLWRDLEREKYELVWSGGARWYRDQNDGLPAVDYAFEAMGCQPGETLIDWGTGTGESAQWFQDKGLKVTGFDIAYNCLNNGIDIPLVVGCMWEAPVGLEADYAYCTDVLEHIPEDYVRYTIDMLRERSRKAAFIQVDTVRDMSGDSMDPPQRLHLTIKSRGWWQTEMAARWSRVEASPGLFTRWRFLCFP